MKYKRITTKWRRMIVLVLWSPLAPIAFGEATAHGAPEATQHKQDAGAGIADASLQYEALRHGKEVQQFVDRVYGPVIDEMNVAADVKAKLRDLLAERTLTVSETNAALRTSDVSSAQPQQLSKQTTEIARAAEREASDRARPQALRAATTPIDEEISRLLEPASRSKVVSMIASEYYLSAVTTIYAPVFESHGCPLSGDQRVSLAVALKRSFAPEMNPRAGYRSTLPLNAHGLTTVDDQLIEAVKSSLSVDQVGVLYTMLAIENRKVRQ